MCIKYYSDSVCLITGFQESHLVCPTFFQVPFGPQLDAAPFLPQTTVCIAGLDTYSGAEELELCLLNAAEVVEELVRVPRGKPRLGFLGRSCRLSLSTGVAPRQRTVYIVSNKRNTQSHTHLTTDHFLA